MGTGIVLSTVHRFKGLEADNVFIVEPQLIPFPYYVEQPWQVEQERNIDYVARTRAIVKLEYITDWSCFPKVMAKMLAEKAAREGRAAPVVGVVAQEPAKLARGAPKYMDVTPAEVKREILKLRAETYKAVDSA